MNSSVLLVVSEAVAVKFVFINVNDKTATGQILSIFILFSFYVFALRND